MALTIDKFGGIIPRLNKRNLPKNAAAVAVDCDLRHNHLQPWRRPRIVPHISPAGTRPYAWGDNILDFPESASVAEWRVNCPRLIITQDGIAPQSATLNTDGSLHYEPLGLESPTTAPNVLALEPLPDKTDQKQGRDMMSVSYVYTFANKRYEESCPSFASQTVDILDGAPVRVAIPVDFPDGVEMINIYRAVSGYASLGTNSNDETKNRQSEYFLVNTIKRGQIPLIIDRRKIVNIGRALTTLYTAPPPSDLQGLIAVRGGLTLAGFRAGNRLHFSVKGECWNWAEYTELALDDNIVALASNGDYVHVATDGAPYAISAELCEANKKERDIVRHLESLAAIAGKDGICATPIGTVYISSRGIVLLQGRQAPQIISSEYWAADDWRDLHPEHGKLAYYEGTLFIATPGGNFILTIPQTAEHSWSTMWLSATSQSIKHMFTTRAGELLITDTNGQLWQWNADSYYRSYYWASADFSNAQFIGISAVRVHKEYGDLQLKLLADGVTIMDSTISPKNKERIPRFGHALNVQMVLEGTASVYKIGFGASFAEMGNP